MRFPNDKALSIAAHCREDFHEELKRQYEAHAENNGLPLTIDDAGYYASVAGFLKARLRAILLEIAE